MVMIFCAKTLGAAIVSPQRALTAFFVVPLLLLVLDRTPATQMMVLDAIFGVGFIAYIFLITLRMNQVLSESLLLSSIGLMLYSMLRSWVFGDLMVQGFEQGMELVQNQMPALLDQDYMAMSTQLMQALLPSIWGVGQILALFMGYFLFHKSIKIPLRFEDLKFPVVYNLMIIAILPLYFVEIGRYFFINALILLCMIPLIQGFALVSWSLSRIISSGIVRGIIMIFILLYAFIPLTLIGFADSWLSIRNINRGGNTA